jgi:two-component system NarL family response regulator
MMKVKMKLMLVDDHKLFLEGLQYLLKTHGIDVVGTAVNGREALIKAREFRPDLILMDIKMPECDGIDALKLIKYEMPDIKIVMLTTSEEDDDIFNSIKYGAFGYLMKDIDAEDLIFLLSSIERGEITLPFGLASKILSEFRDDNRRSKHNQLENNSHGGEDAEAVQEDMERGTLTPRQLEILEMVAAGLTYKEAGEKLGLTERTVKYHMGRIIELLHYNNRAQVIAYAARMGLGSK